MRKTHTVKRIPKLGRKGRKGQTHLVRAGARNPGASTGHGSRRRPF